MSTSDSGPATRLPWQSSPDAEGTSEQAAASAVEPPAWPHHDLIRRIGATTDVPATVGDGAGRGSNGRSQASPAAAGSDVRAAAPAATEATAPAHRRPTKFLADLARAMHQAADESRAATLAQCQADVTSHIEAARVEAETAAGEARRRADEDVAALGEWSKAEMARIEREAAENTAARRVALDAELAEQQARLELELERVAEQAKAFEREMETFFVRLLHEEDPSAFATMASQLPEPPVFEPWRPDMDPTAADAPEQPAAGASAGPGTRSGGSKKGRAAAAEHATGEPATDSGSAAELSADEVQARIGGASAGMPAMGPGDFAAAEAEAADWAIDVPAAPGTAAEHAAGKDTTRRDAAPADHAAAATAEPPAGDQAGWPKPPVADAHQAAGVRTQISVTGLVSVASIAAFKRLLSRLQGVSAVQVTSGPEGEFLFGVTHEERVDLGAAVVKLQGFDAQIVTSGSGVINVTAVDPEAA